jgi:hypothetical protein
VLTRQKSAAFNQTTACEGSDETGSWQILEVGVELNEALANCNVASIAAHHRRLRSSKSLPVLYGSAYPKGNQKQFPQASDFSSFRPIAPFLVNFLFGARSVNWRQS